MADLLALAVELAGNPQKLPFTGDNTGDAAILNDVTLCPAPDLDTLSTHDDLGNVGLAEYAAIADADAKEVVSVALGLDGDVGVGAPSKAREIFVAAFGGGSVTIAALSNLIAVQKQSRIQELKSQGVDLGVVKGSDVASARALP